MFHACLDGVTIAADRSDVLAAVIGSGVDERVLATRLLLSGGLYPLDELSIWQRVSSLPADYCLVLEPDGRSRTRRWWHCPDPVLSLTDGAEEVRAALIAAVGTCTAGGGTISADLSGGLDSTSLCHLAKGGPARLVTQHVLPADPSNDDIMWARRAQASLPQAQHITVGEQVPSIFAGVTGSMDLVEEPAGWTRDPARTRYLIDLAIAAGSRLHLMGGGGDELFTYLPTYLHDLIRSKPLTALSRLRSYQLKHGARLLPLMRALVDRTSFRRWLTRVADHVDAGPRDAPLAWGPMLTLPSWATPHAVEITRDVLREVADTAPVPLARQRGQHLALMHVRVGANGVRHLDQGLDLPHAAPFLDDAVVEAVLSVRLDERALPHRYKPLLTTAMHGILPDPLRQRSTKGVYDTDVYQGFRQNRAELLDLFDTAMLAQRDLIDPDRLRRFILGPHPHSRDLGALDPTLSAEVWLRSLTTSVLTRLS